MSIELSYSGSASDMDDAEWMAPTQRDDDGPPPDTSVMATTVNSADGKKHELIFCTSKNKERELVFTLPLANGLAARKTVPLREVVAVKVGASAATAAPVKLVGGRPRWSRKSGLKSERLSLRKATDDIREATRLYIYVIRRLAHNVWRLHTIKVDFASGSERFQWESELLREMGAFKRPSSLLIFINPFSGRRSAPQIYKREVAPTLRLCGIHTTVVQTESKEQMLRMLREDGDLYRYDGVLAVGGDGHYNEVVGGLIERAQLDAGVNWHDARVRLRRPSMRVGAIPCGSTNSLCQTINGNTDATTAALHAAIGDVRALDVATIRCAGRLIRFSTSFVCFGFLGDVIKDSERFRSMGPIRYEWATLRTLFRYPSYAGQLSRRPLESAKPAGKASSEPILPNYCHSECNVCPSSSQADLHAQKSSSWCGAVPTYSETSFGTWHHVFACLNSVRSRFVPHGLLPSAHLGDGAIDLCLARRMGRLATLGLVAQLWLSRQRGHRSIQRCVVTRFSYAPLCAKDGAKDDAADCGTWNVDGEIVTQPAHETMHFRVHRKLIDVYTRGIESTSAADDDDERRHPARAQRKRCRSACCLRRSDIIDKPPFCIRPVVATPPTKHKHKHRQHA